MSEIATSIMNKNSMLYGEKVEMKNEGPSCVDMRGEEVNTVQSKPDEAPIYAVREK